MTALRTPVAAQPSGAAAGTTPGQKGDTRRAGGREPVVVKPGEELDPAGLSSLLDALRQPEPEDCWQDQALCAQVDGELFYPEKGGSTREAKSICAGCPVRMECLEYAMDRGEHFGIWGGMSERERRRLRWRVA